jgi:3-hydroxyisobutyrate dehydrogenase-like beta-hydroxyacid dehydrogenase
MSAPAGQRVGFIGLGDMGGGIAASIARAGFDLTVFDLREEAMAAAEEYGARRARSVGELATSVDVLATCVLYDSQVEDLFLGKDGIIAAANPGLVTVIHSSILPETVTEVAAAAAERGVLVVDAPVSGGRDRSRAGELTVMVGASDEAFATAEPVLEAVAKDVIRVGEVGAGQVVKLGNNIMALANALVAMEAVRFVNSYGVSYADLFEVAAVSSGASRAVESWSLHDRYRDEHPGAGTPEHPHLLAKDLRYAVGAAQERLTNLPIVALCAQLSPRMYEERWGLAPEPRPYR